MKTSYSRAQGMRAFHTCIYDITNYIAYWYDITDSYIINQIFGFNHPHQGPIITPTSEPSNESVGEWRRRNERMGRWMRIDCMDLKNENENN